MLIAAIYADGAVECPAFPDSGPPESKKRARPGRARFCCQFWRKPYFSNATEIFGNLVFADGDSFSVSVFEMLSNGNSRPVALTLAFSAVAVPLPAAGLLLLTALAGAGMVGRRRRTAALAA